ncbi:iron ABC transporter permease [Pseudonocardia ailaonensis]|uniref:Iron ABC transporter permease n=1 Tax=Pseudonocardia ailaonensis TaxID=367279 RepID=A0ABN2NGH6_9PSEU
MSRSTLWWAFFVIVLALLVLRPLVQLQERALADGARGLREAFSLPTIGRVLATTAALGIGATAVAVLLGVVLAVSATMLPRGARWMAALPIVPLVVPPVAAIIGWLFLLAPNVGYLNTALRSLPGLGGLTTGPLDIYSPTWIIVITGVTLSPFVFLFVHSSLRDMGGEYADAAATCGAGRLRTLRTVTVPLLRPSITYSAGIVVLLALGQFNAPLLLGRAQGVDVLTTEMYKVTRDAPVDFGLGAGLGTPLILAGVLVVVLQRIVVGDSARFVVARGRAERGSARTSPWAAVVVAVYTVVVVVLPMAALVYMSLSPYWSGSIDLAALTTGAWRDTLGDRLVVNSIGLSVRTAAIAAVVAVPVGLTAAWALSGFGRIGPRLRGAVDVLSMAPVAVPAALLGFGFLFAYAGPPVVLYGSSTILVVVYVTLMVPHATRMQLAPLLAIGRSSYEASRACGAGMVRTVARVLVPQLRGPIAATTALVFVLMTHEFSATLMVRSVRTRVLGTALAEAYEFGLYPKVAVVALVMVVVTMAGVLIALALGGKESIRR